MAKEEDKKLDDFEIDTADSLFQPLDVGEALFEDEKEEEAKDDEDDLEEDDKEPKGDEDLEGDEVDEDDKSEDDEDDEDDSTDSDEDEEETIVGTIIDRLGFEFTDEELADIEDTRDGIAKLVEVAGVKMAKQSLDRMFEESPNAKMLYDYETTGGNAQEFMEAFYPQVDFASIKIAENDVDSQKAIIQENLRSKGFSDDRINRQLQAIEDSGNLLDESKDALADLQQLQEAQKKQIEKDIQEAEAARIERDKETWNQVDTILSKDTVSVIPLPKAKQQEFKDFLTVDPATRTSKRNEKLENMSFEERLALDLVIFYGFENLAELFGKKGKTKANEDLKKLLDKKNDRGKNNRQDPDLTKDKGGAPDASKLVLKFDN